MDPHRWAKIESLYHSALAKKPGERPEYLAAACAQDVELQHEVESLLSCADAPLVSPVAGAGRWPPGFHLGSYEILAPLGAGGMGEVYRARDSKLRREVAVKVLPSEFQRDPARLARFEREAQVLASLNHPRIAAIYGLEEFQGIRFLVLELVEGPTLADRLASESLESGEALRIGIEIAEALEAAHDKGVIHRDLKPANIKLTADGRVKVLDFGLAKALRESAPVAGDAPDQPKSTATTPTIAGVVMGTPAYMSPEQAQGKSLDRRTDTWSFAVVMYEMLTGKRPFDGQSVPHIIVHVLEQEPDWNALPPGVPAGVRELLGRCLEKEPAQRLRDIADVRLHLQALAGQAASRPVSTPLSPVVRHRLWLAWGAAAIACLAVLVLAFLYFRSEPSQQEVVRLEIPQPGNTAFTSALSVSPDGRKLAYVSFGADGIPRLWVRSLQTFEAQPLAEAEGTIMPFWSPDSRFIAYGNAPDVDLGGKLFKIEATGGLAQVICDAPTRIVGGFWTGDGRIVFGGLGGGLLQVAAAGGTASPLKTLDASRHESSHWLPSLLPDGKHFLYSRAVDTMHGGLYIGSLDGKPDDPGARVPIPEFSGFYGPSPDPATGYLLFVRGATPEVFEGTLMAQPFDNRRLELTGKPVPLAEHMDPLSSIAATLGVLAYRPGPHVLPFRATVQSQPTWFDRQGKPLGTAGEVGAYVTLALSPDGTQVAFERLNAQRDSDLWLFERARGVTTRFTLDPGRRNAAPVWSPDGKRIAFAVDHPRSLKVKASNGAGNKESLSQSAPGYPTSWSHDGRFLLFYGSRDDQKNVNSLSVLSLDTRKASVLLDTESNERGGRFSPDGRFISYVSNESGRDEIYIRPFDPATQSTAGSEELVSKGGGDQALWRGDGKELFYLAPDGNIMSVEVTATPVFHTGVPKPLFKGPNSRTWDVTSDGKQFLIPVPVQTGSSSYKVVLNWTAALKR